MKVGRILIIIFVTFLFQEAFAQRSDELTTRSSRAKRAFERATDAYRLMDYQATIDALQDAVRHDRNFVEAHILLGEVYHSNGDYTHSIGSYETALSINPSFFPPVWFYLGESYLFVGRYEEAQQRLATFLQYPGVSSGLAEKAHFHLATAAFAIKAKENPVPFDPVNLGVAVNSPWWEYSPALTTDEKTLIFTRRQPWEDPAMMVHGREHEDFYVSTWQDGQWSQAISLGPPINTAGNEGAQSLSADGRHLYFTACNRPGGLGSCDIYYAVRQGNAWSQPVNMGQRINSSAWDSQPSISSDGNTLYFASARPGSLGKMDIWFTTRNAEGQWETARNLGPEINTSGREMSPFIHPDNHTLYFSSDGHTGMGGLDLFYSRRSEDGSWQKPVNIGYPINTHAEEFSLIVSASGKTAYFSSDQFGGFGQMDLYTFELYEEARPQPVTYMRGIVFDRESNEPLEAAFELLDVGSGETVVQSASDRINGEFLVAIPTGRELALNVSKAGYLFFSEFFAYDARQDLQPYLHDIPLQPIRKGETVILRNIFFDHDSFQLREESGAELLKLTQLLESNPGMSIRINGHTDSTGSVQYNQTLSENRAQSVYQFLITQGIDARRLGFKGYADSRPVDTNETESGRANNRRTEFEILELNNP